VRDITQLLHNARHGDPVAEERLMESIYSELHRLASRFLSAERPDHTLQATAESAVGVGLGGIANVK
jgi:hypothetical protein